MDYRFALHTGSLDTTPLAETLQIARATGWDAIELRHVDFLRAGEAGHSPEHVLELVRASGLPVAAVGVERGWMFAAGEERSRLLRSFAAVCGWARALGCDTVMSAVDAESGPLERAVDSLRAAGDLAAEHDLTLALELNVAADQFNTLDRVREVVNRADHPNCGLLLDTYHIWRTGPGLEIWQDVMPEEIAYCQYSDVPADDLDPKQTFDRLPPGTGVVPFRPIFEIVATKGYAGYWSYEALNHEAYARDPAAVAGEALEATRAALSWQP
ncbi:MAG: sugar phosphate isomerase/epimerase [Chloroflexota bacterium]|nr:sugar phosphate isomerase/epimerase [Chloroflexota bacterium]